MSFRYKVTVSFYDEDDNDCGVVGDNDFDVDDDACGNINDDGVI